MAPFRFLDLPREVRDNIYTILLCTFPPPDSITDGMLPFQEDFSPSILRVNKQIYSESYDVMIKGNRFVRVTSTGGLPLADMARENFMPLLAAEPYLPIEYPPGYLYPIECFRGYTVHITIGIENGDYDWENELDPASSLLPVNMIMLFRDVETLCHAIMESNDLLEDDTEIMLTGIDLAPVATNPPYQLEAPTTYFSSAKIQEDLLEPFRRVIRNMPRVDISGIVETSLAQSALEDFARDKFEDANALIESWTELEAQGTKLFKQGNGECIRYWNLVDRNIEEAHHGPMWARLVEQGGSSFVAKAAELCYTISLNVVAHGIDLIEDGHRDLIPVIENTFVAIQNHEKEGYWGCEHSWEPSRAQERDKKLRFAKFLRLWGKPDLIPHAVSAITYMAEWHPNDAGVLEEKRKIEEWRRTGRPVR